MVVWAPPGGGVEHGEAPLEALRRELDEEIGLALETEPPLLWHQRVVAPGHAEGYDGVINDYYLIETNSFAPQGSLGAAVLRGENTTRFQWWALDELQTYMDEAVFGPRNLPALLAELVIADHHIGTAGRGILEAIGPIPWHEEHGASQSYARERASRSLAHVRVPPNHG